VARWLSRYRTLSSQGRYQRAARGKLRDAYWRHLPLSAAPLILFAANANNASLAGGGGAGGQRAGWTLARRNAFLPATHTTHTTLLTSRNSMDISLYHRALLTCAALCALFFTLLFYITAASIMASIWFSTIPSEHALAAASWPLKACSVTASLSLRPLFSSSPAISILPGHGSLPLPAHIRDTLTTSRSPSHHALSSLPCLLAPWKRALRHPPASSIYY